MRFTNSKHRSAVPIVQMLCWQYQSRDLLTDSKQTWAAADLHFAAASILRRALPALRSPRLCGVVCAQLAQACTTFLYTSTVTVGPKWECRESNLSLGSSHPPTLVHMVCTLLLEVLPTGSQARNCTCVFTETAKAAQLRQPLSCVKECCEFSIPPKETRKCDLCAGER